MLLKQELLKIIPSHFVLIGGLLRFLMCLYRCVIETTAVKPNLPHL